MRNLVLFLFLVFIFYNFASEVEAETFYVDNASKFQNALNTASQNGLDDVIYVEADITITNTLTYTTPNGDNGSTLTIIGNGHSLDGQDNVQIMYINTDNDNSDNDDDAGGDITIKGLTFKKGNNNNGDGGGLYVETSAANVAIEDNTFSLNSTNENGGGAVIGTSSGTVTLTNNTFSLNRAGIDGGGAVVITDSGTVTLTNNIFYGNNAVDGGGAVVGTDSDNVTLTNNIFSSNRAGIDGGGAVVGTGSGTVILTNNTFSANSAGKDGGGAVVGTGLGTIILTNNTFSSNSTNGNGGGAVVMIGSETATLTNNTFYANNAVDFGGGLYGKLFNDNATLEVYNNIIWGNTASNGRNDGDDIYIDSDGEDNNTRATVKLYNNDLGQNSDFDSAQSEDLYITNTTNYSHGGNITDDPHFVNPANGDFHLQANSPCIDAGDNNAPAIPATDFEGDQRVIDGDGDSTPVVDMGADEYRIQMHVQATPVPTMTQWGMIIFMMLLGSVAIWQMKNRSNI